MWQSQIHCRSLPPCVRVAAAGKPVTASLRATKGSAAISPRFLASLRNDPSTRLRAGLSGQIAEPVLSEVEGPAPSPEPSSTSVQGLLRPLRGVYPERSRRALGPRKDR